MPDGMPSETGGNQPGIWLLPNNSTCPEACDSVEWVFVGTEKGVPHVQGPFHRGRTLDDVG